MITRLESLFTHPFNPLVTFNPQDEEILFFTQSFSQLTGLHSSTKIITLTEIHRLNAPLNRTLSHGKYTIYQWEDNNYNSLNIQKKWVNDCIHELRTSSTLIDLGIDLIGRNGVIDDLMLLKIKKATQRQKVSTIVASDLVQLLSTSQIIEPTSITKIIRDSILYLKEPSKILIYNSTIIEPSELDCINPMIFTNYHFLKNFFSTLFLWLEKVPITVIISMINPVSVEVSLNIPYDQLLVLIPGFSLIMNYIQYIVAYFNGRVWCTHSTINFIFQTI